MANPLYTYLYINSVLSTPLSSTKNTQYLRTGFRRGHILLKLKIIREVKLSYGEVTNEYILVVKKPLENNLT